MDITDAREGIDQVAMTGLELLRAVRDGRGPRPGISTLLGMQMTDIEEGRAVFQTTSKPEFSNPLGTVHGGIAATLLDSAMGCAVHSTLPAGAGYTTIDLAVTYLRAASLDGQLLRAEGQVIHVGGRVGTASGTVVDADGQLIATGTTTCMIFR